MKLVKTQPTQYTIVCNSDEIDIILTMIKYYVELTHSETDEYARTSTFSDCNPLIADISRVVNTLNPLTDYSDVEVEYWYDMEEFT